MIPFTITLPSLWPPHLGLARIARDEMKGRKVIRGACRVCVQMVISQPKQWPKERRQRHNWASKRHSIASNVYFLVQGLKGIVYADDRQIVELTCSKRYGSTDRVIVTVEALEDDARAWCQQEQAA